VGSLVTTMTTSSKVVRCHVPPNSLLAEIDTTGDNARDTAPGRLSTWLNRQTRRKPVTCCIRNSPERMLTTGRTARQLLEYDDSQPDPPDRINWPALVFR